MLERLTRFRRDLHRIPELDFDLPETTAYVRRVLETLDCDILSPGGTGLCAWFDAGKASSVAFRADMDALPITEQPGAAFASQHPGKMHACGHDGHMAMMLEFAHYVNDVKAQLTKNVLLVFQPAEETTGGAHLRIRDLCGKAGGGDLGLPSVAGFTPRRHCFAPRTFVGCFARSHGDV